MVLLSCLLLVIPRFSSSVFQVRLWNIRVEENSFLILMVSYPYLILLRFFSVQSLFIFTTSGPDCSNVPALSHFPQCPCPPLTPLASAALLSRLKKSLQFVSEAIHGSSTANLSKLITVCHLIETQHSADHVSMVVGRSMQEQLEHSFLGAPPTCV